MSLYLILAVIVAGTVAYFIARLIIDRAMEQGAATARLERSETDLAATRRQGEIMAEHKDADDVADDLEEGKF